MNFVNKSVYFVTLCIMTSELTKAYMGIRPGKIIEWNLKKRHISQRDLAESIGEHYQTINAVIKGRRSLTVETSLKLDSFMGFDEGFLYMLQGYYEIDQYRKARLSSAVNGVPDIRRILFWDTDFDRIDWGKNRDYVISRVMERGNRKEKDEIARFYGISSSDLYRLRK